MMDNGDGGSGGTGGVVANAGPDQNVNGGAQVQLDGSASSDSQGDPLNLSWQQVAGTAVTKAPSTSTGP